jgi:hypothetical protein
VLSLITALAPNIVGGVGQFKISEYFFVLFAPQTQYRLNSMSQPCRHNGKVTLLNTFGTMKKPIDSTWVKYCLRFSALAAIG